MAIAAEAIEIRKATEADVPHLRGVLASAFQDDPGISWLFPETEERRRVLPGFFDLWLRTYLPYREVYATRGLDAAAVWVPPGAEEDEEQLVGRLIETVTERHAPRVLEGLSLLAAHHPSDPHCYLLTIGTLPGQQSRGTGSALMRPVLERCDQEGIPAYLEASSRRNRDLYRRHGFEVIGHVRFPNGPTTWPMWREPR